MKIHKKQLFAYATVLLVGLLAGALLFGGGAGSGAAGVDPHAGHAHAAGPEGEEVIWTCSMHPQIRNSSPGKCPLCAMDLIPAASSGNEDPRVLTMTEEAVRLAQIRTAQAMMMVPEHPVYVPGRVVPDETRLTRITAHVNGRLVSQRVAFVGAEVVAGEVLAVVWSPDLITAQQELLDAAHLAETSDLPEYRSMAAAAREKLRYWGLSAEQIAAVESRGEVRREIELLAPHRGVVTARNKRQQDYIAPGEVLYEIADLSRVWMEFEAFEQDLPWMRTGNLIRYSTPARPGQTYAGRIAWMDPVVDPLRRTVRLRVEADNQDRMWRPDMLLQGTVLATPADGASALVVPSTAVLWTGPRSVLYVAVPDAETPTFEVREVTLGPRAGEVWLVLDGVSAGEHVVVNGAFKIDAEFQLRDKVSMMNRSGGSSGGGSGGGHQHGTASVNAVSGSAASAAPASAAPTSAAPTSAAAASFSSGVSAPFRTAFSRAMDAYFQAKDALVASDASATRAAAGELVERLGRIPESALRGEASASWLHYSDLLQTQARRWQQSDGLPAQRDQLFVLTQTLMEVAERFGVDGLVYVQYCPMAYDDAGAQWLSNRSAIENPYLPETMLGCGEVIARIQPSR